MKLSLVGRDAELAVLDHFLAGTPDRALCLTGKPGIGKTSLWEAGMEAARRHGARVLATRANEAEARLSFTALIDLLDEVKPKELIDLPRPQRRALDVAVLRAEPGREPIDPRAIGLGLLNAIRALSAARPLLIAIDDVSMLDAPSADALVFAARRLKGEAVSFLLARRSGPSSALERVLGPGLERLEVGGLSLGALRRVLSERLGLALPRQLLRRVDELTQGNPLFALEVGRTLADRGLPAWGRELPVPDEVEALLDLRVAALPKEVRSLLLAVALSGDLSVSQLAQIAGAAAVDEGLELGVLTRHRGRLRASHPLLAAAATEHSTVRERRDLHTKLAMAVSDEERRARHLSLAADGPDDELGATVAKAAAGAVARGARLEAVELGEQALRLTPADSPERTERLLTLAEYMEVVGDTTGVRALLAPEIERLPPGPARAQAHLLLASDLSNADEVEAHFEKALRESEADPGLRARLLTTRATDVAAGRVERLRQCQEWVEEARTLVHGHGCDGVEHVLEALGWIRLLRGQALDDLVDEAGSLPLEPELYGSVERIAAIQLTCRGQLEEARASFGRLLRLADERGEMWSYFALRLQLCELELRAGRWAEVERLLEEWDESLGATFDPARCRCEALLAAGRGFPDEAEKRATEAITGDRAACVRWSSFEALRARGLTALLAGDLARAAESLTEVWDHCEREGVEEPGVFPVAPELVEVFLELDEPAEASRVTARLGELARAHAHPWGLATERRCSGLIGLRAGDDDAAAAVLAAAAEYDRLGLAFDRARTLLAFGRTARRLRKWGLARNPLEEAAAAFAQIGSSGWADAAHSELARVGARRPAPQGALTPTEQRVASLAADGLSNKEIAAELFVTVNTVEKHLSHAYEKLGLRSRGQLAARLKPSA